MRTLELLTHPLALVTVALVAIAAGLALGGAFGRLRTRFAAGAVATFAPPALLALLYAAAMRDGCAGGSCAGAMIGLALLVLPLAPVSLLGIGLLLRAGAGALHRLAVGRR